MLAQSTQSLAQLQKSRVARHETHRTDICRTWLPRSRSFLKSAADRFEEPIDHCQRGGLGGSSPGTVMPRSLSAATLAKPSLLRRGKAPRCGKTVSRTCQAG